MKDPDQQSNRSEIKRTADRIRRLSADDLLSVDTDEPTSDFPGIARLVVRGLLSFKEEVVFDFGRLNILIGPNGTGKSNLIDCLRILRNAPFDIQETFADTGFEDWIYRGFSEVGNAAAFMQATVVVPEVAEPVCHQLKLGPPVQSRAQIEEVIRTDEPASRGKAPHFIGSARGNAMLSGKAVGGRRRQRNLGIGEYDPAQSILSQIRDISQYPEITRLGLLYSNFRIYSEWSFGRTSALREPASTGRSDARISESMNDLALALNALERTSAHQRIRELLQELKETYRDYVTRIIFGRVGLELVEVPFANPVPAKRLSDGTLRFLALASILLQPAPPPLICLEEPELGMHPDMIRMVARMIADAAAKTQIIVSTHSEHLLTALQDDFDALFAFDAGVSGSVVRSFTQQHYRDWRQEHSLGELWTSGEFGGNRW